MPVLNPKTGKMEPTPKEREKEQAKKAIRDKHQGKDKTKLSQADKDEILIQLAREHGLLD